MTRAIALVPALTARQAGRLRPEEALERARAHAPAVEVDGHTAAEVMAGHLARGCDG